ncbi:MAG: class I SAM-dependent methyltransferase [Dehalococcoidia bacterium]|nr:class I SAM-dependent methyltransferase [Dehalococcoidia bacterium]
MSNLNFYFMSLVFKFRDFFAPRINILKEAGIKPGFHVLDLGCGPGGYIIPLATLVGATGRIYALDIHPLAIKMVQRIVTRKKLTNVKTIRSDCKTGLQDNSLDIVLLYDILHDLGDTDTILEELHRVLKQNGILSVRDHHMNENEIASRITSSELFKALSKGEKTYNFIKAK